MEEKQQSEYRYHAFISYRHADNKNRGRQWATWLHQALETYEVPKDLVGQINGRGELIPERIYPVFRDEEELPAHSDLAHTITEALEQTNLLVVLCSPRAVASTYVADEISYFKRLGRSDRIIAAIIDGEPNASWDQGKHQLGFSIEDECFPLPLQFEFDEYGQQTEKHAEPIAADFRVNHTGKTEEGWTTPAAYREYLKQNSSLTISEIEQFIDVYEKQTQLMLLKVIAGILGVPLGDLTQRDKAYQLDLANKRQKQLRRWLGIVMILSIISICVSFFAYVQKYKAESERDRSIFLMKTIRKNVGELGNSLRVSVNNYMPNNAKLKIVPYIDGMFDALLDWSDGQVLTREDFILIASSYLDQIHFLNSGDAAQKQKARALLSKTIPFITAHSYLDQQGVSAKRLLSKAYQYMAEYYQNFEANEAALEALSKSKIITEDLVKQHHDVDDKEILGDIYILMSRYEVKLGEKNKSEISIKTAIAIYDDLLKDDPTSVDLKNSLNRSLFELAKNFDYNKDFEEALNIIKKQYSYSKSMLSTDSLNINKNIYFISMALAAGMEALQLNLFDDADFYLKESLFIGSNLINKYPDCDSLLLLMMLTNEKLGLLSYNAHDFIHALEYYKKALDITKTRFMINPNSSEFQTDFAIAYTAIADTESLLNHMDDAIFNYKQSIIASERHYGMVSAEYRDSDRSDIVHSYSDMAMIYAKQKQYDKASNLIVTGLAFSGINIRTQLSEHFNYKLFFACLDSYADWVWINLHTNHIQDVLYVYDLFIKNIKYSTDSLMGDGFYKFNKNIAHAYLLSGDYEKAILIYKKFSGYKFENGIEWKDVVLDDFRQLKNDNLKSDFYNKVAVDAFRVNM